MDERAVYGPKLRGREESPVKRLVGKGPGTLDLLKKIERHQARFVVRSREGFAHLDSISQPPAGFKRGPPQELGDGQAGAVLQLQLPDDKIAVGGGDGKPLGIGVG
jgi:hypothetical protein